jgi:Flp pilus assembly protein TadD
MELKGTGDLQGAWAVFEALIAEHPEYAAAYSPAGDTLVALGRSDEARAVYRQGIELCARKDDAHLRANLEDALAGVDESNA